MKVEGAGRFNSGYVQKVGEGCWKAQDPDRMKGQVASKCNPGFRQNEGGGGTQAWFHMQTKDRVRPQAGIIQDPDRMKGQKADVIQDPT